LLDILALDVLAELLDRLEDLLLALNAEVGPIPRALDAHGDLNGAEVDRKALAAGVSLELGDDRVVQAARSKVDAARPRDAHAIAHQPQVLVAGNTVGDDKRAGKLAEGRLVARRGGKFAESTPLDVAQQLADVD